MLCLLLQHSFSFIFGYVCDLVNGLVLDLPFCSSILLNLICFTCG